MKILNPSVSEDIRAGRPLKLNLGSGPLADGEGNGLYGVDIVASPGLAIQADLNEPLDLLPDNSVGEIFTYHCLEHIERFLPLMEEIHRILRPDGHMTAYVPHFSNPYYYSDPTHVRFFGLYTMYYFADPKDQPLRKVPAFYSRARFRVRELRISLMPRSMLDRLVSPFLGTMINRSTAWQDRYERRLCRLFPAAEIRYVVVPVK